MSNPGNVIGGHKANLSNPNTSAESKKHSEEVLDKALNKGEVDTSNGTHEKDQSHVVGGLKATLTNDNVSETAKENAKEKLAAMNEGEESGAEPKEKDYSHVVAGLRATLHNPNVSEEAKKSAMQKLKDMGSLKG
ncbi:hypothetical protein G7Y79_00071g097240 [Physcia stellaris]|nr:hypothetical protein G7Y79_00071g097240 [Physcia stellaris]